MKELFQSDYGQFEKTKTLTFMSKSNPHTRSCCNFENNDIEDQSYVQNKPMDLILL